MRWRSVATMVLMYLLALVPRAMAQQPPETHPVSEQRDIVMGWDRSSMPGDIELWAPRTVLGYSLEIAHQYGRLHLTCQSDADAAKGRCPTRGTETLGTGESTVWLRLMEQRSGLLTEVEIVGGLNRGLSLLSCGIDYWLTTVRPLWTSRQETCGGETAVGTGASLKLPTSALARLVAGKWSGELILQLKADPDGGNLATYTFTFDFTITDFDAVSIYLPEFEEATPHFGLNLHYDPIGQSVGGRAVLDMCLYDGLGSQSQYLGVTARDTGARPPGATGYSAWHNDGGSDDTQRLDYTITLDHNGARVPLRNGEEEQLLGIDTARLRLVLLPGMSLPVFCVPTPLTFETPRVPISSKRPGGYIGDLKLELRVPTATP